MSAFLDDDLAAILRLRWQLVDAEETGAADRPYGAAWARAELVLELLTDLYDEAKFNRVAGLVAPGEVEGLGDVLAAAGRHASSMRAVMTAASGE